MLLPAHELFQRASPAGMLAAGNRRTGVERDVDGCNVVSMNGGSARGMEIWAVHRWEAVIHRLLLST